MPIRKKNWHQAVCLVILVFLIFCVVMKTVIRISSHAASNQVLPLDHGGAVINARTANYSDDDTNPSNDGIDWTKSAGYPTVHNTIKGSGLLGTVNFGPDVLIFDPSMSSTTIQSMLDKVFRRQQTNQFGSDRYALLFKPGTYNVDVNLGFYTQLWAWDSCQTRSSLKGREGFTCRQTGCKGMQP